MDRKYLRNLVNIVLFLVGVVLVCLLVPRLVIFFMPFVVGWIIALIAKSPGAADGEAAEDRAEAQLGP